MPVILIVNGPNLNLVGNREVELYGTESFDVFIPKLAKEYEGRCTLLYQQSNVEGTIIDYLQAAARSTDGIVLNAGAYTHTSLGIADAISAIAPPVVEVHITNIMAREDYRKTSFISSKCVGTISGLGMTGYKLAIDYLLETLPTRAEDRE